MRAEFIRENFISNEIILNFVIEYDKLYIYPPSLHQDEDGGIIILEDKNEKEMSDPGVQAMFQQPWHKNLSTFKVSQDSNELPKWSIRADGNIYHIFNLNNFRDVLTLCQDKSSNDVTVNEFKLLTSTCWNEKPRPFTFDMIKDKYTSRYRLGINSKFIPDSYTFCYPINEYIY